MDLRLTLDTLLAITVVAVIAPLVVGLLPGRMRIPQVVMLLAGGIVIGPHILGLGSPVGAGVLTVLVLPTLAIALHRRAVEQNVPAAAPESSGTLSAERGRAPSGDPDR